MSTPRAIPKHLFPLIDGEFNDEWAKKTFPYAHMFISSVTTMIPKSEDLELWKSRALQIRKQVLDEGNKAGKEKVLSVAINKYNLFMPCRGTNTIRPNCIQDVLDIIADKEWYNSDKKTRLEQIYMMMYGIKKVGFNQWAIELEENWLKRHNLIYITGKETTDHMYNTRGCIYSTIIQIFSNTNTERFRVTMLNHHNEYIFVRKKEKKNRNGIDIDVVPISCRYGRLYLGKVKGNESEVKQKQPTKYKSFKMLHEYGEYWVKKSLRCGMEVRQLQTQIELWKESMEHGEASNYFESGK